MIEQQPGRINRASPYIVPMQQGQPTHGRSTRIAGVLQPRARLGQARAIALGIGTHIG